MIDPHRLRDVLDAGFADIFEGDVDVGFEVVMHRARNGDAAHRGLLLQPRRNVDTVAKEVPVLDHHIAQVDADAHALLLIGWQIAGAGL